MGATSHSQDHIIRFINGACDKGVIGAETARALLTHRLQQLEPAPLPARDAHPAFMPRSEPAPTPVVAQPVAQEPAVVTPPQIRRPRRTEVWARYARQRSKKMWGTLSADFAANALTYLGVLLSIGVIFTFFAFGYFAEAIGPDHKQYRPLVEAGVVVFFLGLAWVLRHRTGIPQTSAAIELIGLVLLPIMMSASFRDGCTPSYRPWCLPPDIDGPGRWTAYGVVGLITTGVYAFVARRRRMYAYLVGPMLWIAAGAFGLYLDDGIRLVRDSGTLQLANFTSDGISAPQLIAVLVTIGISIAAAGRLRRTSLGSLLAVPIVRSGVAFAPLVGVVALVFAYSDAVVSGVRVPGLADLAWPAVITTGLVAVVFALGARADFAWHGLGDRLRRELVSALNSAAYLLLAAAWVLTIGFGVTVGWIGVGLVCHAILVGLAERRSDSGRATLIVQFSIAVGSVLALASPPAAVVAWTVLSVAALLRLSDESFASATSRYVPLPASQRRLQLWVPVLVLAGGGLSRIAGLDNAAPVLLLAAAGLLLTRWASNTDLRSLAGIPTTVLVTGGVVAEILSQALQWAPTRFSLVLAGAAAASAVALIPRLARLTAGTVLATGAAIVAARAIWGTGLEVTTWADTAIVGAVGLALVLTSGAWRGARTTGHVFVLASAVRSLPFEQTAILGFAVLAAAHVWETIRQERGVASHFFAERWLSPLLALLAVAPIALLSGRRIDWIVEAPERLALVVAALGWIYGAAAIRDSRPVRLSAVPLAYTAALSGVAVSVGSVWLATATTGSAAVLMAAIALKAGRPLFTAPAWMLSVACVLLFAAGLGASELHLELLLHGVAFAISVGAAQLSRSMWARVPVALGASLLPLAIVGGDAGWLAWQGLAAGVAYAYIGRVFSVAWLSIPASLGFAAMYAGTLADTGWNSVATEPLLWMPLAAALVGGSGLLPGRRSNDVLTAPATGVALVGFALGAFALMSAPQTDAALVCLALIQVEAFVIRRSTGWLVGSGTTLVLAGLVAGGFWAPLATFALTLVLGGLADRFRTQPNADVLRAATAMSLASTVVLTGVWLRWGRPEIIVASVICFVVLLLIAVAAELWQNLSLRLRAWRTTAFVLSQAAALVAIAVAERTLLDTEAAGVLAGIAAFEAALAGVVGTVRRSQQVNLGAAVLGAVAYSQAVRWLAWTDHEFVAVTGVVALSVSVIATMATRAQSDSPRLGAWVLPLHGLALAAAGSTVAVAVTPIDNGFWVAAAVLLGVGVHLSVNAWAAPAEWPTRAAAVSSWLGSAALAMLAAGQDGELVLVTGLALAATGLLVSIAAGSLGEGKWRFELLALWAGLEVIAVGGLLQTYTPFNAEVGLVLILAGAASAAYGILSRRLELVELALVVWLGSMLILVNDRFGIGIHAAVLISSVSLLGVLELERVRRELNGEPDDRWLNDAEWALLLTPLTLAAVEMLGTLWFGFVLLAEGTVLATWGTFTQVRRRALTGVAAMALSIVLFVAIPTVHGILTGLSAGTWMAAGGIAAIIFILAGSTIERQRHRIGRRLARIGEILDEWD